MKIAVAFLAAALVAPAASAQDIHFEDFENGLNGWSTSGIWSVDQTPSAFSPTKTLNVNNGTDYSAATSTVTAASPDIPMNGYTTVTLTLKCNYETEIERPGDENNYDLRTLAIGSGSNMLAFYQFMHLQGPATPYFSTATAVLCDQPGTWHTHTFTITLLPSQSSVNLSFFFWTNDTMFNAHEGWFIDDVKFTGPLGDTGGGGGGGGGGGYVWHGNQVSGPDHGSGSDPGACGLVGLEAVFALVALRVLRRRRRA